MKKIRVNESTFRELCRLMAESEQKVDKYGNPIPRYGQGWGKDASLVNRQGYNQDGTKGPWFSRSVAVATAVILHDTGGDNWYILANQRGTGAADYQGYWNLPCGYLDYNEEAPEAAVREVREETGINISPAQLKYFGNSSSPDENRQNVVFFYVAFIEGEEAEYPFSKKDMEENEVDGIQWVPIDEIGEKRWAFNHDELIQKILAKYANRLNKSLDGDFGSGRDVIQKVIDILKTDGDTEYAVQLLQKLL